MFEVHAISRAIVDAKLTDTAPNGLYVAGAAEPQSIHAHLNASSRLAITQAAEPLGKTGVWRNSTIPKIVSYRIQIGKWDRRLLPWSKDISPTLLTDNHSTP
jgi:hypothetical protein